MNMMLWLLCEHHVLPGVYYHMDEGEKVLLRAFYEKIMTARRDRLD